MSERRTPFSLVLIGFGCMFLALAIVWATLPWTHAAMATCFGFLGMEVGMVGARWCDEQKDTPDAPR